jgi:hypothetical protein
MNANTSATPTFVALPPKARAYVATAVVAGAGCLVMALTSLHLQQPVLFSVLLALGVLTSAAKIDLPLGRSQSNLSLSHAVNFWSLFTLGPAATVCIATASAWAQCTLRAGTRNPLHRVVFSVASLTVTVAVAGVPAAMMLGDGGPAALLRAAAVVAPLYFFVNTSLVAAAIALSTRQPLVAVWHRNFLWSAPSYLVGAALAAVAATATERSSPFRSTSCSVATTPSSRGCAKSRIRRIARWKCSSRPSRRSRSPSRRRQAARPSTSDRSSSARRCSPKRPA